MEKSHSSFPHILNRRDDENIGGFMPENGKDEILVTVSHKYYVVYINKSSKQLS